MNRSKTYIIIGVLLILAGIFIGFLKYGDSGSSRDREIYYISGHEVEFKRPDGYNVLEVTDTRNSRHSVVLSRVTDDLAPVNGEGLTAITIDVFYNPPVKDAETWVRQQSFSNFALGDKNLVAVTVDEDVPAFAYSWDGLYPGRSVVFAHDGKIFMVSGTYMDPADQIYEDFDKIVESIETY